MSVAEASARALVTAARIRKGMTVQRSLRFIEWTVALVIAGWGLQLVSPLTVFSNPGYRALRVVPLTEAQWGGIFLAVALVLSAGVKWRWPRLEIVGLVSAAGLFAFLGVMFAVGNLAGFGWLGQFGYAALCLHVLRRLNW